MAAWSQLSRFGERGVPADVRRARGVSTRVGRLVHRDGNGHPGQRRGAATGRRVSASLFSPSPISPRLRFAGIAPRSRTLSTSSGRPDGPGRWLQPRITEKSDAFGSDSTRRSRSALDRLNFRADPDVQDRERRRGGGEEPPDGGAWVPPTRPPSRSPSGTRSSKPSAAKGNRRNLMFTGDMLRNFLVRTVSENKAKASNSTRKDRIKAWINQQDRAVDRVLAEEQGRRASTRRTACSRKRRRDSLLEKALGGKQL